LRGERQKFTDKTQGGKQEKRKTQRVVSVKKNQAKEFHKQVNSSKRKTRRRRGVAGYSRKKEWADNSKGWGPGVCQKESREQRR